MSPKTYSEEWWTRKDIRTILRTIQGRIRLREQEAEANNENCPF